MSYLKLSRLNFCYQLFAFLSILGMGAFAIASITNDSILYGWVTALFALICAGCIKRANMYQTKMDNFDYKYYIDNKYLDE
jgi:hypothetical protein